MAKYQVHAVRRDTGQSTSIEVTADSEQQATEIAEAQGLDVQSVHTPCLTLATVSPCQ